MPGKADIRIINNLGYNFIVRVVGRLGASCTANPLRQDRQAAPVWNGVGKPHAEASKPCLVGRT